MTFKNACIPPMATTNEVAGIWGGGRFGGFKHQDHYKVGNFTQILSSMGTVLHMRTYKETYVHFIWIWTAQQ